MLIEHAGVKFNLKQFPWKTMSTLLAEHGVVCINYPEGVLMPGETCDRNTTKGNMKTSKGISDLTLQEQARLIHALDHEQYPIRFKKPDAERCDAIKKCM